MKQRIKQATLMLMDRVSMEIFGHSYRWLRWQRTQ